MYQREKQQLADFDCCNFPFYSSKMINKQRERTSEMKYSVKEYKWKEYQLSHLPKDIFQCASKHGQLFNKQFLLDKLVLYFLDKRTAC